MRINSLDRLLRRIEVWADMTFWMDTGEGCFAEHESRNTMFHTAYRYERNFHIIREGLNRHAPHLIRLVPVRGYFESGLISHITKSKAQELAKQMQEVLDELSRIKKKTTATVGTKPSENNKEALVTSNPPASKLQEEWSVPMSETEMRVHLGNMKAKSFKAFAKEHGIRKAGSRKLSQIRLDGMDANTRHMIETGRPISESRPAKQASA